MDKKQLLYQCEIYRSTIQQMEIMTYSYLGGKQFKQHVRKKRPSEDGTLYQDLINNTAAQPICRYIVDTINEVVFEPGIKRDLKFCTPAGQYIEPDNCEWAQLMVLDADLQNRSLNSFMEQIGVLSSIYGWCWVGVDLPREEEGNLGRPYVVAINPMDVWDYEFDYYGGKPLLKYIKIKESEDNENYFIRCSYLGTERMPSYWVCYRVGKNSDNKDYEIVNEGTYPPGMSIPIFMSHGRRDPRRFDIGVSDIDTASDVMREYYKLECEAYTCIQFAHTLIRADKGIAIPVHAGAIVRATQGQVETIPVDTGDVNAVIQKQHHILEQIEALTGLGGLRNTKNQLASGVAIIEERKQLHRLAKAKARLLEITEEMIWTYAARFMDMRWAGEIVYNTDYESKDSNYRLALMREALSLAPDNQMLKDMVSKELIAMLAPDDQVAKYEQVYVDNMVESPSKVLFLDENETVLTRDLGSQIPAGMGEPYDEDTPEDEVAEYGSTPIYVGVGMSTAQAVASQIQAPMAGR